MEKKKWVMVALMGLAVLVGIVLGVRAHQAEEFNANFLTINGVDYPRTVTHLDLNGAEAPELDKVAELSYLQELDLRNTGIGPEDYETIHTTLPECHIQWSVPFQGQYLDNSTQEVTVTSLTAADIETLDYLPELSRVDGTDCGDYDQLLALQQHRPACEVSYLLNIQGTDYPLDTKEVTLANITAEEAALMQTHLPQLEAITLTELQTDPAAVLDLMDAYPQYTFCWDMELWGVPVNSLTEFIDFSNILIDDLEGLEAIVTRLPNLTQVDMCDCGIDYETMDALNRRHENIKFVWMIDFEWVHLRTDTTELIPCILNLWFNDEMAELLRYFTDMECLDLGHHKITNCEFVRYMPKLKYLLLGDTYVSDLTPLEGLEDLIYLEIFLTHVTDYTPLLSLKKLESLNLCYTEGDPEVIAQLTWVDYIRWVNFERYYLTPAEQKMLRESLPDTYIELEIGTSSTGGQWRLHQNYFDMRDILGMYYMTG